MRRAIERGFGLALGFTLFRLVINVIVAVATMIGLLILIVLVAHGQVVDPDSQTITVTTHFNAGGVPDNTMVYQCDWVAAGSVNAQDYGVVFPGNHGWIVCDAANP